MDRAIQRSKLRPWYIRYIYVAVLIAIVLLSLRYYVKHSIRSARVNRNEIEIAKVLQGDLEGSFTAEGRVTPLSMYQVEAYIGGRIDSILRTAGDHVKAGETIMILSNDDLKLNLLAQETAVTEQVNNLNNALIMSNQNRLTHKLRIEESLYTLKKSEREYNSTHILHQKGHISNEEFTNAKELYELASINYRSRIEEASTDSLYRKQQIEQLQQSVSQIQQGLKQISARIGELNIKAPMDGVITEMELKPGQIVSIGTKIALIEDAKHYFIQLKVDQFYSNRLELGSRVRLVQFEDTWLEVAKIHPKLSNESVLVDLAGVLPSGLKSNQSVAVDVVSSTLKNVLYLPQGQYLIDSNSNWVFAMETGSNKAKRKAVKFGFKNMKEIEVLSGLAAGDEVIISSYKNWMNKDIVTVK